MNYQIKVGVIKLDKLETWKENKDPFDILDNCKEIERHSLMFPKSYFLMKSRSIGAVLHIRQRKTNSNS